MQVRSIGDYSRDMNFVNRSGITYGEALDVYEGADSANNLQWPNRHGQLWVFCPMGQELEVLDLTTNEIVKIRRNAGYYKMSRGEYIRIMGKHTDLKFRDVHPSRERFVRACRKFKALDYHVSQTWVEWEGDRLTGTPRGHASCVGLILLGVLYVRLLPDGFDLNLSPENFGGVRPVKTLWNILHENCTQVDKESLMIGDILLFRYADVRPDLTRPHHIGVFVEANTMRMIHAASITIGGEGKIKEEHFGPDRNPLQWSRLEEVWRINNLR